MAIETRASELVTPHRPRDLPFELLLTNICALAHKGKPDHDRMCKRVDGTKGRTRKMTESS